MNTGENEQGLRKIMDFTSLLSIAILIIHFYLFCYSTFHELGLTATVVDKLLSTFSGMSIFNTVLRAKLAAVFLLAISLFGAKGKKNEKIANRTIGTYIFTGLVLYFFSLIALHLPIPHSHRPEVYMGTTIAGYLLILTGGTLLSRIIKFNLNPDVFNKENETFPQEERLLENEFSINNAITGYFQNVKTYKDEESKLKSIQFGSGLHKAQTAFKLCGEFEKNQLIFN